MVINSINTKDAPTPIGNYSQAIRVENTVYLSGQIPIDPETMELISNDINAQVIRVFENLKSIAKAADGSLNSIVKLTVFLIDLNHITVVNEVMKNYFNAPCFHPQRLQT